MYVKLKLKPTITQHHPHDTSFVGMSDSSMRGIKGSCPKIP